MHLRIVCLCKGKIDKGKRRFVKRLVVRTSPLRRSGVDPTVLPANTPHLPLRRSVSPEGATAVVCSNSSHLIAAFIDPERMKG